MVCRPCALERRLVCPACGAGSWSSERGFPRSSKDLLDDVPGRVVDQPHRPRALDALPQGASEVRTIGQTGIWFRTVKETSLLGPSVAVILGAREKPQACPRNLRDRASFGKEEASRGQRDRAPGGPGEDPRRAKRPSGTGRKRMRPNSSTGVSRRPGEGSRSDDDDDDENKEEEEEVEEEGSEGRGKEGLGRPWRIVGAADSASFRSKRRRLRP